MRTSFNYLCAALLAVTSVATLVGAQHPQKPGKWQITVQMEMPGTAMKMPPVTSDICVTEEDLADPNKAVPNDPASGCKVTDHRVKGNVMSWGVDCPAQQMTGTGEITFAGDTFTGDVKLNMAGQEMASKYSGKWLGACTK